MACFSILVIGPVLVLFFKDVNFFVGPVHITQLNAIAIFMAALLILAIIVTQYLVHDCSAEIDLKKSLKQKDDETDQLPDIYLTKDSEKVCLLQNEITSDVTDSETELIDIPMKLVLQQISKNMDAVLMFVSTFFFTYCLWSGHVLLALLTNDILGWDLSTLTSLLITHGILYFLVLMIISGYCNIPKGVYIMSIVSIIFIITYLLSMIGIKMCRPCSEIIDIVLMVCFIISFFIGWVIEAVIVRCMLAKMVPSHCQSFTESCRNAVSRFATILASVSSPLMMPYLEWWSIALIFIVLPILIVFLQRKKSLIDIKEISFGTC